MAFSQRRQTFPVCDELFPLATAIAHRSRCDKYYSFLINQSFLCCPSMEVHLSAAVAAAFLAAVSALPAAAVLPDLLLFILLLNLILPAALLLIRCHGTCNFGFSIIGRMCWCCCPIPVDSSGRRKEEEEEEATKLLGQAMAYEKTRTRDVPQLADD